MGTIIWFHNNFVWLYSIGEFVRPVYIEPVAYTVYAVYIKPVLKIA